MNPPAGTPAGTMGNTLEEGLGEELKQGPGLSPATLDDGRLDRLLQLPGIIAFSVFFEGFPVQSRGEVDPEQIAAAAEDMLRAGKKVARDMYIGVFSQVVLEGNDGKCIIAPFGDMFVCLITSAGANLGLIRLAIASIQAELK